MYKIENFLFEKFPSLSPYKEIITFIVRVFLLFYLLLFIKFIHKVIFVNTGLPAVFDLYEFMIQALIYPTEWFLHSLGYETIIVKHRIAIAGSGGVIIHGQCLGTEIFAVFLALIIAYPLKVKIKTKALFIISGLAIIQLMNTVRVILLSLKNYHKYELFMDHHDLFNIIVYALVFLMFYVWIKYFGEKTENS